MPKRIKSYHRTPKKYHDICVEFKRLSAIKEGGVSKFSLDYILLKIEQKYYLSPDFIARIVREEPTDGYLSTHKKNNK